MATLDQERERDLTPPPIRVWCGGGLTETRCLRLRNGPDDVDARTLTGRVRDAGRGSGKIRSGAGWRCEGLRRSHGREVVSVPGGAS